jgi:hypothetical protein
MGPQAASASVRVQLPLKRLTTPEQYRVTDLALDSPGRESVAVSWADGRQAHATDQAGLDNLENYPKADIVEIDVHYADGSHLVFEPKRGVVTVTGGDADHAVACAIRIQNEYRSIPDRRGVIVGATLLLRISMIAIIVSVAILCLHFAANELAPYRIGLLILWGVVLVGCGTWSEYLEWRMDPARTRLLPARSHWYSQPAVPIATISTLTAVVLVAAAVFVRLHR